nr:hypothetical protein [uncultured Prevotella sp.]
MSNNIFTRNHLLADPDEPQQQQPATTPPVSGDVQSVPVSPLTATPPVAGADVKPEQNAPVTPVTDAPAPDIPWQADSTPVASTPLQQAPVTPAPAVQVPQPQSADSGEPTLSDIVEPDITPAQPAANPAPAVPGQPASPSGTRTQAPAQPQYYADWAKTPFLEGIKGNNKTIAENISDYNKWAKDNHQDPLDIFDIEEAITGQDANKSYQDNEAAKKNLARKQKWEQIGNFLAHLGNFVGTLNGAPNQPIESAEDLSKRQQALKERTEGLSKSGSGGMSENLNNILTAIVKDRAEKRAEELNNSNIALRGAQKNAIESDEQNKKDLSSANVNKINTQTNNIEQEALRNKTQAKYIQDKDKREGGREKYVRGNLAARTNSANASATRSLAAAANSTAETRRANIKAYGDRYGTNRYQIWARNRRVHPDLTRQFMEENNIHKVGKNQNWDTGLIDQYNAYISDKQGTKKPTKHRVSASNLLD